MDIPADTGLLWRFRGVSANVSGTGCRCLCDFADNIFVEDINFVSWSRGIVRKQSLDSGVGSFINEILPFVAWKRRKYYLKVDKNGTSQECPNCGAITGKKELSERVHRCDSCGHIEPRDTASAK